MVTTNYPLEKDYLQEFKKIAYKFAIFYQK